MTEIPYKTYHIRLAHYGVEGLHSDIPSLNLPSSPIVPRGNRARAIIITRLLHDLEDDMVHLSTSDEHVALDELRRHVAHCILDTCLKRELASQSDEGSYIIKNRFDLAAIGGIMADLSCNNPVEVNDVSVRFENATKIAAKLFADPAGKIHVKVSMPKLTLSAMEFRVLMNVGLELVLNSVRYAFDKCGTGQILVSMKEENDGQNVEFCVADNGYRPQRLSFGRGLRLVSRVTAVVGGDIVVRWQPSGGTGVALTFPRARTWRQRS